MEQIRKRSSAYVYFVGMLINVGALMIGITGTWSSSAISKLNGQKPDENPLSEPATNTEISLIVSLLSIGIVAGPPFALSIDKIGRKNSLLTATAIYALCFLVLAFAETVWLFCLIRFLFGVLNGWMFVVMPNYLSEIAEKHNRGNVNCLMKVNISFGMVFMYCLGPYVSIFVSSLICLIPIVLIFVLIVVCVPESPYYLVAKGDMAGAKLALIKLRRHKEVLKELQEILVTVEESFKGKRNVLEIFKNVALLKCLLLGFALMALQQLCGSAAILFYLQTIFEAAGSTLSPEICAIIVGVIQFFSSFTSPLLVDRLGRRFLLLISSLGISLSLTSLGIFFYIKNNNYSTDNINWLPIASLMLSSMSYAMGLGPVPYTIISEIFPPNFKAVACTTTIIWLGIVSFIPSLSFPFMLDSIGTAASFWTFAGFTFVGLVFVYFCVPETKNKSFLEIQILMKILKE